MPHSHVAAMLCGLLSRWGVEPWVALGWGALYDVIGLALEVLAVQPPYFLIEKSPLQSSV